MKEMKEYLAIAKKMIGKYGYKQMLKDDDVIGEVASSIMKADWKFNGVGTLEGFRSLCAKRTIINFKRKQFKNSRTKNITYENPFYVDFDNLEYFDLLDKIQTLISPKMYDIFISSCLNDESYESIGSRYSLSRERVRQLLQSTLETIRQNV